MTHRWEPAVVMEEAGTPRPYMVKRLREAVLLRQEDTPVDFQTSHLDKCSWYQIFQEFRQIFRRIFLSGKILSKTLIKHDLCCCCNVEKDQQRRNIYFLIKKGKHHQNFRNILVAIV